jgi:hypothetical protein
MCREYAGYFDGKLPEAPSEVVAEGAAVDPAKVPYALRKEIAFRFGAAATGHVRLAIHTSDRDSSGSATIVVDLNGHVATCAMTPGLGLQLSDPDHLAQPATFSFDFPDGALRRGTNRLRIGAGGGWFTWDALEVCTA